MADQTGEQREAKRGALHRPLVYILAGVILALAFFWGFELVKARVTTAEAAAKQSESEATASQATSEKTEADLKRISELRQRNVVAPQEFDAAKSAAAAGVANLAAARDKAASDLSKVAE